MPTWKKPTEELPPQRTNVLIATKEGYVFTSRLVDRGSRLRWNGGITGSWPLDRVVAWTPIPKIDITL